MSSEINVHNCIETKPNQPGLKQQQKKTVNSEQKSLRAEQINKFKFLITEVCYGVIVVTVCSLRCVIKAPHDRTPLHFRLCVGCRVLRFKRGLWASATEEQQTEPLVSDQFASVRPRGQQLCAVFSIVGPVVGLFSAC